MLDVVKVISLPGATAPINFTEISFKIKKK